MDPAFTTERLVVRAWRPDEADRVFDLYSRPEVAQWLGAAPRPMASLEAALQRIDRWAGLDDGDGVTGCWAVERKEDGVVAGTVLLVPLPEGEGELEVGWHLHPDSWHRGYATEAARGALGRAFDHGVDEVFAVVRPGNDASVAVCRRLGMADLGRTDRYYGTAMDLFRAVPPGS